jgi:hypothetical protein
LARVTEQDSMHAPWPCGGNAVESLWGTPGGRTRSCCQVVIVRQSLSVPLSQPRYRTSSDREADTPTQRAPLSARWDSDVLFTDGKEERGLDHSQLMNAHVLVRFWSLAMLAV